MTPRVEIKGEKKGASRKAGVFSFPPIDKAGAFMIY